MSSVAAADGSLGRLTRRVPRGTTLPGGPRRSVFHVEHAPGTAHTPARRRSPEDGPTGSARVRRGGLAPRRSARGRRRPAGRGPGLASCLGSGPRKRTMTTCCGVSGARRPTAAKPALQSLQDLRFRQPQGLQGDQHVSRRRRPRQRVPPATRDDREVRERLLPRHPGQEPGPALPRFHEPARTRGRRGRTIPAAQSNPGRPFPAADIDVAQRLHENAPGPPGPAVTRRKPARHCSSRRSSSRGGILPRDEIHHQIPAQDLARGSPSRPVRGASSGDGVVTVFSGCLRVARQRRGRSSSTARSPARTPSIRPAWPSVAGRIRPSFSRASKLRAVMAA